MMMDNDDAVLLHAWLDATAARLSAGDAEALSDLAHFSRAAGASDRSITALLFVIERVLPTHARRRIEVMRMEPIEGTATEITS